MIAHSIREILSQARLEELLGKIREVRAGVLGDIALDAYWQVDMKRSRLSRETPHFPKPVVSERYSPGAGGNVAANLAVLGMQRVNAFSVIGEDAWGPILKETLRKAGVLTEAVLSDVNRRTPAYVKPILVGYESQQEDARLDFENTSALAQSMEERLVHSLEEALPELDALLVADQFEEFGIVTRHVRDALIRLAGLSPQKVFVVDSRRNIGLFQNMALKPNGMEALKALGGETAEPGSAGIELLAEGGSQLSQGCGRPVYLTLGEAGVLVCTPERQEQVKAAPVRPPLDIVGAGDMFVAALAGALAARATLLEAGAMANLAAAVTVEKLNQTGSASLGEIVERYRMVS